MISRYKKTAGGWNLPVGGNNNNKQHRVTSHESQHASFKRMRVRARGVAMQTQRYILNLGFCGFGLWAALWAEARRGRSGIGF